MKIFLLALTSVGLSVAAQFALKQGVSGAVGNVSEIFSPTYMTVRSLLTNGFILFGMFMYAASAVFWLGVLSHWDVSKAYPIVGIGFILTLFVGWSLGEHVTLVRLTGVLLIFSGVVLVARS